MKKKKTNRIQCNNAQSNFLTFADESSNAQNDLAQVSGIAYNGGIMSQYWSGPMVVDLAGMEISAQVPLLLNHFNSPSGRLGVVTATVEDGSLTIAGGIDTQDEQGADIVAKGKKYEWQLSIGADVKARRYLQENETATVNGRDVQGPLVIVTKSRLREVSVVAVGADAETHMTIAASFTTTTNAHQTSVQGDTMNKKLKQFIIAKYNLAADANEPTIMARLEAMGTTIQAMQAEMDAPAASKKTAQEPDRQVQASAPATPAEPSAEAEVARVTAIAGMTHDRPELRARAIAAGWTPEHTKQVVDGIQAAESKLPLAVPNINTGSGQSITARALEAALSIQAGLDETDIVRDCGQESVEFADKHLRGMGLRDVIVEACRLEGVPVSGFGMSDETIRASFTTTSLPGILTGIANKSAMRAYRAIPSICDKLCSSRSVQNFQQHERYRLNMGGELERVAPSGEIKHGEFGEDKATNKAETYGKIITLSREMIVNDDLGELSRIPAMLGAMAQRQKDIVLHKRLMSNPTQGDGKALFHTDHGNTTSGATTALSADALQAAIAKFAKQTDSSGNPIMVKPKYLVVPTELYGKALELCNNGVIFNANTTSGAVGAKNNILSSYGLTVIDSAYLSAAGYTGYSAKAYYLLADNTQIDTFEIAYLYGRKVPYVQRGEANFDTLGMNFRCFFDFGIKEQDYRGMAFVKGEA